MEDGGHFMESSVSAWPPLPGSLRWTYFALTGLGVNASTYPTPLAWALLVRPFGACHLLSAIRELMRNAG